MPSFTYTTNIPVAGNDPSVDQPNMTTNTNSIASILDEDMIGFGNANGGYHSKITYVDQTGSLPSGVSGTDILYSAVPSGGILELFLQRATGSAIQMTTGNVTVGTPGQTFLPGGIILKWGSVSVLPSGSAMVTFGTAYPNACWGAVAQFQSTAGGTAISTSTP